MLERRCGQAEVVAAMHRALHELCQPLTALQCCLEIGRMQGDPASLREAVAGALAETQRLFASVAAMRAALQFEQEILVECGVQRADGEVSNSNRR